MKHSTPRSTRPARERLARRLGMAALAAGCLAAIGLLSGCGMGRHAHPGEPTARATKEAPEAAKEAPKLSEVQQKLADTREQATLDPAQPYWPYRSGQIYVEHDSLGRAEAALKASLSRDPSYLPSLMLLSKLYYDSGRHSEGVSLLEAARTRAGAGAPQPLLAGLALHYEALGRHDQAAGVAAEAGRAADGKAGTALVYVTLRGDHPEAATALAKEALDDNPRSAANQNNYGITRLRAGDPKAARDAFLRAIDLDPRLPGPYYNLSIVERFFFFNEEAATRWLKAYRERSSEDPDNLFGPVARSEPKPALETPAPPARKERQP